MLYICIKLRLKPIFIRVKITQTYFMISVLTGEILEEERVYKDFSSNKIA